MIIDVNKIRANPSLDLPQCSQATESKRHPSSGIRRIPKVISKRLSRTRIWLRTNAPTWKLSSKKPRINSRRLTGTLM
jgi:hypothetical protein